jgi:hypothetical protein
MLALFLHIAALKSVETLGYIAPSPVSSVQSDSAKLDSAAALKAKLKADFAAKAVKVWVLNNENAVDESAITQSTQGVAGVLNGKTVFGTQQDAKNKVAANKIAADNAIVVWVLDSETAVDESMIKQSTKGVAGVSNGKTVFGTQQDAQNKVAANKAAADTANIAWVLDNENAVDESAIKQSTKGVAGVSNGKTVFGTQQDAKNKVAANKIAADNAIVVWVLDNENATDESAIKQSTQGVVGVPNGKTVFSVQQDAKNKVATNRIAADNAVVVWVLNNENAIDESAIKQGTKGSSGAPDGKICFGTQQDAKNKVAANKAAAEQDKANSAASLAASLAAAKESGRQEERARTQAQLSSLQAQVQAVLAVIT